MRLFSKHFLVCVVLVCSLISCVQAQALAGDDGCLASAASDATQRGEPTALNQNAPKHPPTISTEPSSSFPQKFSIFILPTVYGSLIALFSWLLMYYDSKVPGVYPPTPISPLKYRISSGHTFHLGYTIGLVNGIIVFCLTLGQQIFN